MTNLSALLKGGASAAVLTFAVASSASAGTLPGHGHFVAGNGAISKSGGVLTIDQQSRTGIVNWKTFSIGKNNTVEFDNRNGATLNRVTGGNISRIAGALHGTGSVYIVNNTGVTVLPTGRIVTQGSFAASGRNANGDSFGPKTRLLFTGGAHDDVVNEGQITSTNGRVDLAGRNVSDSGSISARNASVIGTGAVRISGSIAANAVHGHGGNIETSGNRVRIGGARIVGKAWLIDPENVVIDDTNIGAVKASLNSGTSVTIRTGDSDVSGPVGPSHGDGDIVVDAPLAWTSSARLTLNAYRNIEIDAGVTVKGGGAVTLNTNSAGRDGDLRFGSTGNISFTGADGEITINHDFYALEYSFSALANAMKRNPTGRYALAKSLQIGASFADAPINREFDGTFEGLGNSLSDFEIHSTSSTVGLFQKIGGTVRDLILAPAAVTTTADEVGALAGENVGSIVGVTVRTNVTGVGFTGGIVGRNDGLISHSTFSGRVTSSGYGAGGVAGFTAGGIYASSSSGTVTGMDSVGGLSGSDWSGNRGPISFSYSTSKVSGHDFVGGLVGVSNEGDIYDSFASGAVSGAEAVGGLIGGDLQNSGLSGGTVSRAYATGSVHATVGKAGGLTGFSDTAKLSWVYATGDVSGPNYVGGLVGDSSNDTIKQAFARGNVLASSTGSYVGGLVGISTAKVTNAYATGSVSGGSGSTSGGLIGWNETGGRVSDAYSTGFVYGTLATNGGLVGANNGSLTDSYWDTQTSGHLNSAGGSARTTQQLRSNLPAPFDEGVWTIIPGASFPYLMPSIDQKLAAYYETANGAAFADRGETCLAVVYEMAAMAAGDYSKAIDDFWSDGATAKGFNAHVSVTSAQLDLSGVVTQLAKGHLVTIDMNAKSSTNGHFLLAIAPNGSAGFIASDPWTGTRIAINGNGVVSKILDPMTAQWVNVIDRSTGIPYLRGSASMPADVNQLVQDLGAGVAQRYAYDAIPTYSFRVGRSYFTFNHAAQGTTMPSPEMKVPENLQAMTNAGVGFPVAPLVEKRRHQDLF